jgi:hypothetical protein
VRVLADGDRADVVVDVARGVLGVDGVVAAGPVTGAVVVERRDLRTLHLRELAAGRAAGERADAPMGADAEAIRALPMLLGVHGVARDVRAVDRGVVPDGGRDVGVVALGRHEGRGRRAAGRAGVRERGVLGTERTGEAGEQVEDELDETEQRVARLARRRALIQGHRVDLLIEVDVWEPLGVFRTALLDQSRPKHAVDTQ